MDYTPEPKDPMGRVRDYEDIRERVRRAVAHPVRHGAGGGHGPVARAAPPREFEDRRVPGAGRVGAVRHLEAPAAAMPTSVDLLMIADECPVLGRVEG